MTSDKSSRLQGAVPLNTGELIDADIQRQDVNFDRGNILQMWLLSCHSALRKDRLAVQAQHEAAGK